MFPFPRAMHAFFFSLLGELHRYWINYGCLNINPDKRLLLVCIPWCVCALSPKTYHGICFGTVDTLLQLFLSRFPSSLLHTDRPLCAGTDEICMHVRLDYTCRLWEPGPLWSPFTVWARFSFQSTTSNKSHSLIGSGTYKIRGYIPRFLESGRKRFLSYFAAVSKSISIEFYIHQRSDS